MLGLKCNPKPTCTCNNRSRALFYWSSSFGRARCARDDHDALHSSKRDGRDYKLITLTFPVVTLKNSKHLTHISVTTSTVLKHTRTSLLFYIPSLFHYRNTRAYFLSLPSKLDLSGLACPSYTECYCFLSLSHILDYYCCLVRLERRQCAGADFFLWDEIQQNKSSIETSYW